MPASDAVVTDGGLDSGGSTGSPFAAGTGDGGVSSAGNSSAGNSGAGSTGGAAGGAAGSVGGDGGAATSSGSEGGTGGTANDGGAGGDEGTTNTSTNTSTTDASVGGSTGDAGVGGSSNTTGITTSEDATCDGVDDDGDGQIDDDYVDSISACGVGACESTGWLQCVSGSEVDDCVPGSPASALDGPVANAADDDCDGQIDEDAVGCDTTPRSFLPGEYVALEVPPNCSQASVRLWGGAGASGEQEGVLFQPGGRGGAGGYVETAFAVGGTLALYVGSGAASGCNLAGSVTGPVAASGGSGNFGPGANGGDGLVVGGGSGANPSSASRGGDGYYGGGGGGEGDAVIGLSGRGGGGGAASYLLVDGALVALAGGGGGGGGAASILLILGVAGGDGGQGCAGDGEVADVSGGGGGGGGVCIGSSTQPGNDGTPFDAASLPAGQAVGGAGSCGAGGGGYAIVTFST